MKLKKILSGLLCGAVVAAAVAFAGCTDTAQQTEIKGELYTLQQAYDNGYLTVDDLQNIGKNKPDREKLSAETELSIRMTLYNDLIAADGDFELYRLIVGDYFGEFGGGVVVELLHTLEDGHTVILNTVIHNETVAGVNFGVGDYTIFYLTNNYFFSNMPMYWKEI